MAIIKCSMSVTIVLHSCCVLFLCPRLQYVAEGIRVIMRSMMEMEDWRALSS